MVVGREPQAVAAPADLGALAAAAAQDPDLQGRALAGHHVRLLTVGRTVGAGDQGQDVADLLGVVLRFARSAAAAASSASRTAGEPSSCRRRTAAGCSSPFGVRPFTTVAAAPPPTSAGAFGFARTAAGAAQAEIEAARVQGVEQAELLDCGQRGAVPHLHRTGAEPDRRRGFGGQGQDDRRGGAGHAGIEVMLGEPVAGVAEPFGLLGQVDAVAQRLGRAGSGSRSGPGRGRSAGWRSRGHRPRRPGLLAGRVPSGARPRWSRSVVPV